jgi:hypothetical protein
MNFDPESLQKMLAEMQASNAIVICKNIFPNNIKDQLKFGKVTMDKHVVCHKAKKIFKLHMPEYNIRNLCTDKLTDNAIQTMKSQLSIKQFHVSNGCCNNEKCPTKMFYQSVVEAVEQLCKE